MKTQLVLLSGKQGSGKDTTAREIARLMTRQSTKVAFLKFAKPLYDMHDMCRDYMAKLGIQPVGVKDGNLLQVLGTEWGRKTLGENVWVDALRGQMAQVKMHHLSLGFSRLIMVVTDCRFRNEFNGFPDALRVRLNCASSIRKERAEMWRDNELHASEMDLDDYVEEGRFDMIFNTQTQPVNQVGTLICAQLDKESWVEKRPAVMQP